jgi:hypothetical protein
MGLVSEILIVKQQDYISSFTMKLKSMSNQSFVHTVHPKEVVPRRGPPSVDYEERVAHTANPNPVRLTGNSL